MLGIVLVIVVYITLMIVVIRHRKANSEQYLILTFADLMIFYGLQSKQVRQFREQHPDAELLHKCDQLALELRPTSKPYYPPED